MSLDFLPLLTPHHSTHTHTAQHNCCSHPYCSHLPYPPHTTPYPFLTHLAPLLYATLTSVTLCSVSVLWEWSTSLLISYAHSLTSHHNTTITPYCSYHPTSLHFIIYVGDPPECLVGHIQNGPEPSCRPSSAAGDPPCPLRHHIYP